MALCSVGSLIAILRRFHSTQRVTAIAVAALNQELGCPVDEVKGYTLLEYPKAVIVDMTDHKLVLIGDHSLEVVNDSIAPLTTIHPITALFVYDAEGETDIPEFLTIALQGKFEQAVPAAHMISGSYEFVCNQLQAKYLEQ